MPEGMKGQVSGMPCRARGRAGMPGNAELREDGKAGHGAVVRSGQESKDGNMRLGRWPSGELPLGHVAGVSQGVCAWCRSGGGRHTSSSSPEPCGKCPGDEQGQGLIFVHLAAVSPVFRPDGTLGSRFCQDLRVSSHPGNPVRLQGGFQGVFRQSSGSFHPGSARSSGGTWCLPTGGIGSWHPAASEVFFQAGLEPSVRRELRRSFRAPDPLSQTGFGTFTPGRPGSRTRGRNFFQFLPQVKFTAIHIVCLSEASHILDGCFAKICLYVF